LSVSPRLIQINYAMGSSPSAIPVTINTNAFTATPSFQLAVEGLPGVTLSVNTGAAPGSVNLNLNTGSLTTPGTFTGVLGLYAPQSASQLDSVPIVLTVTNAPATLTVPATAVPGGILNVTVANGPGSPTDWVALYCPATQPDTSFVDWKYLNDAQTAPGSGLTGATIHVAVPASATTCNVRLYGHDTFTKLATSATVTLMQATIAVPPTALPGGTLSATLTTGPGGRTDWVALYCPATLADASFVDWKYLSGTTTPPGSGLTGATVGLTVPASATTCNVRWFANDTLTKLATSATVTIVGPTITLPTLVASGDTLNVTVANGPGSPTDWVAFYCPATQSDAAFLDWKYLSDTRTAPASGLTTATLHFPVPASATTCNVRWYANDTFTKLATSAPVTVLTITVPSTALPGGTLSVTVVNGPGSPTDWVALYCPATQPDAAFVDWKYLNDAQTAPGSGLTGATIHVAVPASATTCNVRLYGHDTFTKLATSATVTLIQATITVPPTALPGGTLSATLTNGPGGRADWAALYCPATQPDGPFVDWKYLSDATTPPGSGLSGATLHFTVPASATSCNVRWYANDTFTLLASSATVTMAGPSITVPATAAAGGLLTATLAGGPGSPTDWAALYCPATLSGAAFSDWKYLSNTHSAPTSGLAGATLTFTVPLSATTTCLVRWYASDSFTLLAASPPVTVASPTVTVPATVAPGATLSVTLAGGPGSPVDWVALYCPATQPAASFVDWKYLNNSQSAPGTGVAGATLTLAVPLSATTCQVRWYGNNSFTLLATSSTVTVQ
jgi:hypothetical protein